MCHYKKVLWKCNHLRQVRPAKECPDQTAYREGLVPEPCEEKLYHGLNTIKLPEVCEECRAKQKKTDDIRKELKEAIAASKELLMLVSPGCKAILFPEEETDKEESGRSSSGRSEAASSEYVKDEAAESIRAFLASRKLGKHGDLMMG